jgi:hypothetical protein
LGYGQFLTIAMKIYIHFLQYEEKNPAFWTIGGESGATVKLSRAATATMTANSTGAFTFSSSYTITPSKSGGMMLPESQTNDDRDGKRNR